MRCLIPMPSVVAPLRFFRRGVLAFRFSDPALPHDGFSLWSHKLGRNVLFSFACADSNALSLESPRKIYLSFDRPDIYLYLRAKGIKDVEPDDLGRGGVDEWQSFGHRRRPRPRIAPPSFAARGSRSGRRKRWALWVDHVARIALLNNKANCHKSRALVDRKCG